jgi:Uma2 family endonuclease
MSSIAHETSVELPPPGSRVMLRGISWEGYLQIDSAIGERSGVRLLYLNGDLEIMSPASRQHETPKERISDLLFVYFDRMNVDYIPMGNATLRNADRSAGGEPDLSYCIGAEKAAPDLCIEVVVSSGGIDKLDFYKRFAIPEVWFWQNNTLTIYTLDNEQYTPSSTSRLLPRLNVALFSDCVQIQSSLESARKFRAGF